MWTTPLTTGCERSTGRSRFWSCAAVAKPPWPSQTEKNEQEPGLRLEQPEAERGKGTLPLAVRAAAGARATGGREASAPEIA